MKAFQDALAVDPSYEPAQRNLEMLRGSDFETETIQQTVG